MSVDSDHMEHRWGTRVELLVPASLLTADGLSATGLVRNASVSGAFVETSAKLPLLAQVSVNLAAPVSGSLDACVVRVEESGLALEWFDPGSRLVTMLLSPC